ncbi:hypothetical protein HUJ04_011085 [Dendroctonus ponderosae]|nr:hypothetical protein HUJ04_011085 [Dendroctonus ponderosae]
MGSPIKEFYRAKNVLLTGGTGYIGKMIIAKLLRTTEVKNIYLIVRPKEDVGIDKRVTKMFEEQVFLHIPEATFQDKLHPIEGDLKNKSLGIAKEDQIFLRENVSECNHQMFPSTSDRS